MTHFGHATLHIVKARSAHRVLRNCSPSWVPASRDARVVTGGARSVAGVTAARTRMCRELIIQVVGRTQGVEVDR